MKSRVKLSRRSLMSAPRTASVTAPLAAERMLRPKIRTNAIALAVTGDESHNSDVYRTALTATLAK
jgi:hypothetical protein